jgi:hypothetical protein
MERQMRIQYISYFKERKLHSLGLDIFFRANVFHHQRRVYCPLVRIGAHLRSKGATFTKKGSTFLKKGSTFLKKGSRFLNWNESAWKCLSVPKRKLATHISSHSIIKRTMNVS